MDCSPPGSSVLGILQTRILEWIAISSLRDLPNPGTEPMSPASPALPGGFFTMSTSWEALRNVQFSSVAQSCPILCDPMYCSNLASLSITNSQSLLKLMSIESMMPSNHLILCCPILLLPSIFPSIRVFSNESTLHIR